MKLSESLHAARADGRIGLTLYVIPGFPSLDVYRAVFDLLEEDPRVSVIETTLPVASGFASYQNATIRKAHAAGVALFRGDRVPLDLLKRDKATLGVIYGASVEDGNYAALMEVYRGAFDAVVLEQGTGDITANAEVNRGFGVETVRPMAFDEERPAIEWMCRRADPFGYVYLSTAEATGGKLAENDPIARAVGWIKAHRSDLTVSAGFGVRTPEDVARLARIDALDGVIIGTTFLEAMERGVDAARAFIDALEPSLRR